MKALVLKSYNNLVYTDVPKPDAAGDEVLIEVKACGICGSDIHGMDGSTGRRRAPLVMGHEAAGVISAVGANVEDWKPGDRVTFDSTIYCGKCHFCRRGEINLCDNRRVLGVSCDEYRRDGAFAEYVAVPRHILYRLPDGLSFERAAMVEPLSIAFHAVRRVRVSPGASAVVVGAGIIGLLIIQVLRAAACRLIVAVDIDPERLELARKLGAHVALDADAADVPAQVAGLTGGCGADIAFEVVGVQPALDTALFSLRKGGALVLVGNLSSKIDVPLQVVVTRELDIRGSCASRGEYPDCLDMIARGVVDVDTLISATAPLSEGAAWFKRLYEKEPGLLKVILTP